MGYRCRDSWGSHGYFICVVHWGAEGRERSRYAFTCSCLRRGCANVVDFRVFTRGPWRVLRAPQ